MKQRITLVTLLCIGIGVGTSHNLFSQNVGIGIAVPLEKLHVAGNVRVNPLAGVGTRMVGAASGGSHPAGTVDRAHPRG